MPVLKREVSIFCPSPVTAARIVFLFAQMLRPQAAAPAPAPVAAPAAPVAASTRPPAPDARVSPEAADFFRYVGSNESSIGAPPGPRRREQLPCPVKTVGDAFQFTIRLGPMFREHVRERIDRIRIALHGLHEPADVRRKEGIIVKREEQVFANITGSNRGPLTEAAVRRIFERIIDEMRTIQRLRMVSEDAERQ